MGEPDVRMNVKYRYQLRPEEASQMAEWISIKKSAIERVHAMQQKVTDCQRLQEGLLTQIKWREGWSDSDVTVYDPATQEVIVYTVGA